MGVYNLADCNVVGSYEGSSPASCTLGFVYFDVP